MLGCGHWGMLVVDLANQGTGVASALVVAAEQRLARAGCCAVQIEYEYTHGHAPSQRLMDWYEGKLGYECVSGGFRRRVQTEFRKCRKVLFSVKILTPLTIASEPPFDAQSDPKVTQKVSKI